MSDCNCGPVLARFSNLLRKKHSIALPVALCKLGWNTPVTSVSQQPAFSVELAKKLKIFYAYAAEIFTSQMRLLESFDRRHFPGLPFNYLVIYILVCTYVYT